MRLAEIISEVFSNPDVVKKSMQSTNIKKANDILLTYCSDAINGMYKNNVICRGMHNTGKILLIDSTSINRVSENVGNFCTEYIANYSAEWNNYPKRNNALICTTSIKTSSKFGDTSYVLFPFNRTIIGVCPKSDIDDSFNKTLTDLLVDFDTVFESFILQKFKFKSQNLSVSDISKVTKKVLNIIIDWDFIESIDYRNIHNICPDIDRFLGKTIFEFLEYALNPTINGFKLLSTKDFYKTKLSDNEVWFSGKCIAIRVDALKEVMQDEN